MAEKRKEKSISALVLFIKIRCIYTILKTGYAGPLVTLKKASCPQHLLGSVHDVTLKASKAFIIKNELFYNDGLTH